MASNPDYNNKDKFKNNKEDLLEFIYNFLKWKDDAYTDKEIIKNSITENFKETIINLSQIKKKKKYEPIYNPEYFTKKARKIFGIIKKNKL